MIQGILDELDGLAFSYEKSLLGIETQPVEASFRDKILGMNTRMILNSPLHFYVLARTCILATMPIERRKAIANHRITPS